MPTPIRLLCFDLGGVLVRLSKNWQDVCSRAQIPFPNPADQHHWQAHVSLLRQLELGQIDQPTYESRLPTCLPMYEVTQVLRAFDAWLLGLYPGVPSLLSDLKQKKIPTAILSNTNPRHWQTVMNGDPHYAPLKLLDHPFASHLLRMAKPDPQIYAAVAGATRTDPQSILFFDDNTTNITAAQAAGWHAHLIDPNVDDTTSQIRQILLQHQFPIP